jgi:hypothetical protein
MVASQLEITNGHAARMRFSRFKQHMEGVSITSRATRPKKPKSEKAKSKKQAFDEPKEERAEGPLKDDSKDDSMVKKEPVAEFQMLASVASVASAASAAPNPQQYSFTTVAPADLTISERVPVQVIGYPHPPTGSTWTQVKKEDPDREVIMSDVFVKQEPQTEG